MGSSSQRRYKKILKKQRQGCKGQILVEFLYFALVLVGVFLFVTLMGQRTLKILQTFQF